MSKYMIWAITGIVMAGVCVIPVALAGAPSWAYFVVYFIILNIWLARGTL